MESVSCFGVRVSVIFHLMFVHYTFSSVWVAELSPFGKYLPARLAICSHCILSICNIYLLLFLTGDTFDTHNIGFKLYIILDCTNILRVELDQLQKLEFQ